jgi:hypothetical protein
VYVVLPRDTGSDGSSEDKDAERRELISTRLLAAWQKLEQYNDMIGAPKLMADARLEFV